MRIVDRKKGRLSERLGQHRGLLAWITIGALYTGLVFAIGAAAQKTHFFSSVAAPLLSGNAAVPVRYLQGTLASPPRLVLDIKLEAYAKLEVKRREALETGNLFADTDDFVPADLSVGDEKVRVRIRLKGDAIGHLAGDKWSFRVKVRGDQTVMGMKRFSLHHPQARNFAFEWLFHRALKREDILALRYEFVELVVNGKNLGIYALEEHFDKRLIEHARRREGPILRFNEDLMWREAAQRRGFPDADFGDSGSYQASAIDAFQTEKTLADPVRSAQFQRARDRLEAFRRGELSTSAVFETRILATYYALVDLLGAEHAARWHNIRFYYNPITGKLEPIGFDANAGQPLRTLSAVTPIIRDENGRIVPRHPGLSTTIFRDQEFHAQYVRELDRVSEPSYLSSLLDEIEEDLANALVVLYRDFPHYEFSPEVLHANRRHIRSMLEPLAGVRAHVQGVAGDSVQLRVGNVHLMPLEVVGIQIAAADASSTPSTVRLEDPLRLEARERGTQIRYRDVAVRLPHPPAVSQDPPRVAAVLFRGIGLDTLRSSPAHPFPLQASELEEVALARVPNPERFDFLDIDEGRRVIRVAEGTWRIESDVILPPGYVVQAGPGTVLDLARASVIISRSPLSFHGTAAEPIVIRSSDGTGQGLVVLQAPGSNFRHVRFEGLSASARAGPGFTGAVTFYESPVRISNCAFVGNRAEDSLNLIRSEFLVDRSVFEHASSDALDADFCVGEIRATAFSEAGNDAIDVSGSSIEIRDVRVDGAGDKALSVGESSQVTAERLSISRARVALASKDQSILHAREIHVVSSEFALAAYQKKSEFGPGEIHVERLQTPGGAPRYLVELGSLVTVDGREIQPSEDANVKEILYADADADRP